MVLLLEMIELRSTVDGAPFPVPAISKRRTNLGAERLLKAAIRGVAVVHVAFVYHLV